MGRKRRELKAHEKAGAFEIVSADGQLKSVVRPNDNDNNDQPKPCEVREKGRKRGKGKAEIDTIALKHFQDYDSDEESILRSVAVHGVLNLLQTIRKSKQVKINEESDGFLDFLKTVDKAKEHKDAPDWLIND